jgi:hypothetical protein
MGSTAADSLDERPDHTPCPQLVYSVPGVVDADGFDALAQRRQFDEATPAT